MTKDFDPPGGARGASSDPLPEVPDLDLAPRSSRSSPSSQRKPVVPPARAIASAKLSAESTPYSGVGLEDAAPTGARIELETAPLASPTWAPARVARRHREVELDVGPPARRGFTLWKAFLLLLLLLLLTASGAVYEAPHYVKSRVAEAARRSGLSASVGEVVFRPQEIVLQGTKVGLPGVPDASLAVGEIEVALDGIHVAHIFVRGLDLSLRGPLVATYPELEKWASSLPEPLRLESRAGHVHWSSPFGPGTELEASDVTISTLSGFSLSSPSMLVGMPSVKLGPWRVALTRNATETRLGVGLDPAVPATSLEVTRGADGRVVSSLDVTPSPLSRIGIPPDSVALTTDAYLEAHARLESATPPAAAGKIALSLSSAQPGPSRSGAPGDVQLAATVSGQLGEPMALGEGRAAIGPTKGKMTGTFSREPTTLRLALAFQWPDGASKGKLPSSYVLDTRTLWGGAR